MGHSRSAVTLDTYSHVVPNMLEHVAVAMDEMFCARGSGLESDSCQVAVSKDGERH